MKKINWLMLFKEIFTVYFENKTMAICWQNAELTVKGSGTYTYHWTLKA
jgi:hypothetical protein